mgnify:CR=1 FL=1
MADGSPVTQYAKADQRTQSKKQRTSTTSQGVSTMVPIWTDYFPALL